MDTETNEQPQHTNRLSRETSPYLLQHAHNPVDWYPWSEEALARARREDKPILLSIGYSACHWCHVMEHESFENEAIAKLMNDHFVCIKVDREERPDLDQIYMNSVQMMTGQGGWPMTVFLTPEGEPFYGGTYFPPEDRYGVPGFPRVLIAISETYEGQREKVLQSAAEIRKQLQSINRFTPSNDLITKEILDRASQATLSRVDTVHGGFGGAPKFPNTMSLELLLRAHQRTGDPHARAAVQLTLDKMARGGIYDQLGGGFHRYSVDAEWLVPHFEKMLYDNALLSEIYLFAFQVTESAFYRRIVEETLDYVRREMTSPEGGFYSTQDADSEGEEGKFFLWTPTEVRAVLGEEAGNNFCRFFDVTEQGNFEHRNILHVPRDLETVAAELAIDPQRLEEILSEGRAKLFAARESRVKPGRDEKILTGWNGLMLKSFAEAAQVLDRDDYRQVAINNANFILTKLQRNGMLYRSYKDGKDGEAKFNGYLEDYAYFVDGLVALYGATFDTRWLVEARRLTDVMIEQFWDEEDSGFFFTGKDHEKLINRPKEVYDGAIPSPTAVAADVLLRLGIMLENHDYERKAVDVFRLLREPAMRYPTAFSRLICALDRYLSPRREIAVIGRKSDAATRALLRETQRRYLPNALAAFKEPDDQNADAVVPWLRERGLVNNQPAAYVCENFVCHAPVTDVAALVEQLQKRA